MNASASCCTGIFAATDVAKGAEIPATGKVGVNLARGRREPRVPIPETSANDLRLHALHQASQSNDEDVRAIAYAELFARYGLDGADRGD